MATSTNDDVHTLKVAQILDQHTLIVTGPGVELLNVGEELLVLAIGGPVPGTIVPLVIPKQTLEVVTQCGEYVIAKSPETEVARTTEQRNWLLSPTKVSSTWRRKPFSVDRDDLAGNPADEPLRLGDPVVEASKLSDFIEQHKAKRSSSS